MDTASGVSQSPDGTGSTDGMPPSSSHDRDPRVDAYIARLPDWQQEICGRLRDLIHGVDPDIVVDNDPGREFAGEDQQLDKAIEILREELKTKEKKVPPLPPFPKK